MAQGVEGEEGEEGEVGWEGVEVGWEVVGEVGSWAEVGERVQVVLLGSCHRMPDRSRRR